MRRAVTAAVLLFALAGCSSSAKTVAAPATTAAGLSTATCSALATAWSTFASGTTGTTTLHAESEAALALSEAVNTYGNNMLIRRYAGDLSTLTAALLSAMAAAEGISGQPTASANAVVDTAGSAVAADHQAIVTACG